MQNADKNRKLIDIDIWIRKDHYRFFNDFEEPFFGISAELDMKNAYLHCKKSGLSFFIFYIYQALSAAQKIENFRYKIDSGRVYLYDQVNAAPTILRADGTFGFSYMDYDPNFGLFHQNAQIEKQKVQNGSGLIPASAGDHVIHFSVLPWISFSAVTHARSFTNADSSPKITFGKLSKSGDSFTMPISVFAHHGLMDGYHIALFLDALQAGLQMVPEG